MTSIKTSVEDEEYTAIKRQAEAMGLEVEDFAYAAIGAAMEHRRDPQRLQDLKEALRMRTGDLPRWSDTARSVGAYESKTSGAEERSPRGPR